MNFTSSPSDPVPTRRNAVALGNRVLDDRPGDRCEQVAIECPLERPGHQGRGEAVLDQELDRGLVQLHRPRPGPRARRWARRTAPSRAAPVCARSKGRRICDPVDPVEELGPEVTSSSSSINSPRKRPCSANPTPGLCASAEPMFDVRMTMQRRKSAVLPCWSVRRPSSDAWEEEIPDRRRRLLELVEQDDEEQVAPDGRQRRAAASMLRSASKAMNIRRLVLAHVQADESALEPKRNSSERLRDLRLPRAGRADEEEDAERALRVGSLSPALIIAMRSTISSQRLPVARRAPGPRRRPAPHPGPAGRSDRASRAAVGRRGERREHIRGLELGPAFLRHVRDRGLDEVGEGCPAPPGRQELRELEGLDERRSRGTTCDELLGRRHRGLLFERPDGRPRRLRDSEAVRRAGARTPPGRSRPRRSIAALDRREHRVEHPRRGSASAGRRTTPR